MQVCVACFDEDFGGSTPESCHRMGQVDKLTDAMRSFEPIESIDEFTANLQLAEIS